MYGQPHEDAWIHSEDGLKLHGTWFPQGNQKKVVICFHGYSSSGANDYSAYSDYYFSKGFSMLILDERCHGQSEGKYIGFGCLDRKDGVRWIEWVLEKCGKDVQIMLHGLSMGGATVCMMSGLDLPEQVKGIVSDSAFTSAKDILTHLLKYILKLPAKPTMQISGLFTRILAGYGMDECNAAREVQKAEVPILLIHGSADTFVPLYMGDAIYEKIASPKKKLIVDGAAHMESYYIAKETYEEALDEFIAEVVAV